MHERPHELIAFSSPLCTMTWACMSQDGQTGMGTLGCKFTCLAVYKDGHRYVDKQKNNNEDIERPFME